MRDHVLGVVYLLESLGYIIHPEKIVTVPSQEIELLGMMDSTQWNYAWQTRS